MRACAVGLHCGPAGRPRLAACARDGGGATLRDAAVAKLISDELARRRLDAEAFWVELPGDVRRARRLGLGPKPRVTMLLQVDYEPYQRLRAVICCGRFADVVYRRASQESGR